MRNSGGVFCQLVRLKAAKIAAEAFRNHAKKSCTVKTEKPRRKSMEIHGNSWKFMEIHGNSWKSFLIITFSSLKSVSHFPEFSDQVSITATVSRIFRGLGLPGVNFLAPTHQTMVAKVYIGVANPLRHRFTAWISVNWRRLRHLTCEASAVGL